LGCHCEPSAAGGGAAISIFALRNKKKNLYLDNYSMKKSERANMYDNADKIPFPFSDISFILEMTLGEAWLSFARALFTLLFLAEQEATHASLVNK
jgi:hypothetical protein